jgi:hypothetical protein
MGQIDLKDLNRCPPYRRSANELRANPAEVARPLVAPWMKEPSDLASCRVHTGNVWTLMIVAREAGKREIACNRSASMFPCDNVIDLMRQRDAALRKFAVLAARCSAVPDELFEVGIHAPSVR